MGNSFARAKQGRLVKFNRTHHPFVFFCGTVLFTWVMVFVSTDLLFGGVDEFEKDFSAFSDFANWVAFCVAASGIREEGVRETVDEACYDQADGQNNSQRT
jgi:hypothetical protein